MADSMADSMADAMANVIKVPHLYYYMFRTTKSTNSQFFTFQGLKNNGAIMSRSRPEFRLLRQGYPGYALLFLAGIAERQLMHDEKC